jgi:hypothetical protein
MLHPTDMAAEQCLTPCNFPVWFTAEVLRGWRAKLKQLMWVEHVNPPQFFRFNYRLTRVQGRVVPLWVHDLVVQQNHTFSYGFPKVCRWWDYVEEVERLMEPARLKRLLRVRRMLDIQ